MESDSESETCMVVEIQENELGEIMLVERPLLDQASTVDNRFCVVECKVEPSDDVGENIEIVYLPDYDNPSGGPVLLKQELLLHDEGDEPVQPVELPPGRKRRSETRLRSNPNVILKHRHQRDTSWNLRLDAKDFAQTKTISSVTTIHTNPKTTDGSENQSRPIRSDVRPIELPHKCKYCDRAFRQSVSLQIHSTLHSQSVPDGCHVS